MNFVFGMFMGQSGTYRTVYYEKLPPLKHSKETKLERIDKIQRSLWGIDKSRN